MRRLTFQGHSSQARVRNQDTGHKEGFLCDVNSLTVILGLLSNTPLHPAPSDRVALVLATLTAEMWASTIVSLRRAASVIWASLPPLLVLERKGYKLGRRDMNLEKWLAGKILWEAFRKCIMIEQQKEEWTKASYVVPALSQLGRALRDVHRARNRRGHQEMWHTLFSCLLCCCFRNRIRILFGMVMLPAKNITLPNTFCSQMLLEMWWGGLRERGSKKMCQLGGGAFCTSIPLPPAEWN